MESVHELAALPADSAGPHLVVVQAADEIATARCPCCKGLRAVAARHVTRSKMCADCRRGNVVYRTQFHNYWLERYTMDEILIHGLPPGQPLVTLGGPSFAREVAMGMPTASSSRVVVAASFPVSQKACQNSGVAKKLASSRGSPASRRPSRGGPEFPGLARTRGIADRPAPPDGMRRAGSGQRFVPRKSPN